MCAKFAHRPTSIFSIPFQSPPPPLDLTQRVPFEDACCSVRRRASCACFCLNSTVHFRHKTHDMPAHLASFVPLNAVNMATEFKMCNTLAPHAYSSNLGHNPRHILQSSFRHLFFWGEESSCPFSSLRRMLRTRTRVYTFMVDPSGSNPAGGLIVLMCIPT